MNAGHNGRATNTPRNAHFRSIRNLRGNPPAPNSLEDSILVKKIAMALLLAFTLIPAASFAQVVIRIGPPPPVYERRGPPPGEGYVWQPGYHRYDGAHYAWTPGHYEQPPRRGQRWVAHHWVHRHGQYVLVEGYWR
jgi:hypothetical protein